MKDKYCLDSIVPFQTINQSPTNRSATKQTFSFAKSSRFDKIKANCPNATYAGEHILQKNSGASIGYGSKYDFTTKAQKTPQSGRYNIKGIFQASAERKKGYSIGTSRQKIKFNSYVDPVKLKNPGVGKYTVQTQIMFKTSRAPSFTMGPRTKPTDLTKTIEPQNKNPSPAHYQNNPEQHKTLYASQFKRIGYSYSKSKRFLNDDNKVPGPGDYQNPTNLSNVGKYVVSSHRGGTNAKFDGSKRVTKFDECAKVGMSKPGPGYYRASSEFGQYDGEVYATINYKSKTSLLK